MFFLKRYRATIGVLGERIKVLEKRVSSIPTTVDCETCGCMIRQEFATQGKSEIRVKQEYYHFLLFPRDVEFIFTPWFCKGCLPKEEVTEEVKA